MSKAILVMDMPKSCDGCLLHGTMIGKQICNAEIKRVKDESVKPDWCPLREIPSKYADKDFTPIKDERYDNGYEDGYNTCIDEILGDKE